MSKSSQLLHSLFKCNDTDPEYAASSQVNLPEQIATEVTVYFKSPLSNDVKKYSTFGILHWWHQHKSSYPHLCQLVKHYLCVPASSTPSERAFSTAGNIVTKNRNRLLPANVNILTFLKNNFHYIPKDTKVQELINISETEPIEN